MNKWLFTLSGILLAAAIFWGYSVRSSGKKFNRTITYSPRTFKPYDTRFFYMSLKKTAMLQRSNRAPGGKLFSGTGKTYVVCSPYFLPNESEEREILRFVAVGNRLLLSSFEIEPRFLKTLGITGRTLQKPSKAADDSLKIVWKTGESWSYPGSAASPGLIPLSSSPAVIASDGRGFPSLIQINYGKGSVWIQAQPMTFSNYFLLHKNNYHYLETMLRAMDLAGTSVIWDNFYASLTSASDRSGGNNSAPPEGRSFFKEMIKKHPPLQWAVFTFLAGTLLFLLNYSRRLRQPAERLPEVKNSAMEFSSAIANIYRHRKDNSAIAQKIRLQLHDYLYNTYRITPREFTAGNADAISRKTGKPVSEVKRLMEALSNTAEKISDKSLTGFYRLVYKFIYK